MGSPDRIYVPREGGGSEMRIVPDGERYTVQDDPSEFDGHGEPLLTPGTPPERQGEWSQGGVPFRSGS